MVDIQNYKDGRLESQIEFYDKKAIHHQKQFYSLSVLNLVFTSLIPFASIFSYKWPVALLGVLAAISSGLLLLYKPRELWLEYRKAWRDLERQIVLFDNGIGIYNGLTEIEASELFITECEDIMINQHNDWERLRSGTRQITTSTSS